VTRVKPGIPVLPTGIYLFGGMEEMPAESLVFCTLLGPEGPDLEKLVRATREPNLGTTDIRWMSAVCACKKAPDSCATGFVQAR
jgi:hypothetical protein